MTKKVKLPKGHLPLTVTNAKIVDKPHFLKELDNIQATNYQSDRVNPQQLYKLISTITDF